ncbi:MAG: hypothetical protein N2511_06650 [Thermodesulfovibrionales bacterium]|nr:hypothetical protein [Thermodesulfovibrionales bacterium]
MDIKKLYPYMYAHKITMPSKEQIYYAIILSYGTKVGLAILIITFFLYFFGLFSPYIPKDELPDLWKLPVAHYLQATGIKGGWSWVSNIGKGDFLNFIGIAFLSGITILCFIVIFPMFLRKKDYIYAIISFFQVIVLLFAASGILKTGGH